MESILFQYNPWWEKEFNTNNLIDRNQYLEILKKNISNNHIIFLTGLRRVGKTSLMKLLIDYLINIGTENNRILYLSLDDYVLKQSNLFEMLDEYRKIFKLKYDEPFYLFLDEITYQTDYHQQLKNIYDRFNIKVFATSSSSSLLKDKKAFLTGRSLTYEIKPLNFSEYKLFKNIIVNRSDNILNEAFFKDYLKVGGLPENVLNPNRETLMHLIDDIIQKDIIAYHGLKNRQILRDFYLLLMERSGKQFSINKMANILKISPDTARRYLHYFEETYLIHLIPRWGKTNEKLLSPKKIYACDLGIKYLFIGDRDLGSYFENYIYLQLRNKKEVFYLFENGIELDFITSDKIIVESKFYDSLNEKQQGLFDNFQASKKIIIDDVNKLELLNEI